MTNPDQAPSEPGGSEPADRPPTASRSSRRPADRRVDRVGDLLPERTRDETATGWGDVDDADADEHLRREVPPHHG
jgi:hypothetical protein